jgi:ribosome-associated protein
MNLHILLTELKFKFSRSGGKGGQNVNKVETKVELVFNIEQSRMLSGSTKAILNQKLGNRIDKEGNLRLVSQSERTQAGNRKKVVEKFLYLIKHSLRKPRERIKTTISKSSKLRRLESKRKHSERKKQRSSRIITET